MIRRGLARAALASTVLVCCPAPGLAARHDFTASSAGEAVATVAAEVPGCSWERAGAEGAFLRVELDGRYSQHLPLVRGEEPGEYRIALGRVSAGRHALDVERDARASAPSCVPRLSRVSVDVVSEADPDHAALSRAPIVHVRPGTVERFSDLPFLAYVETLPASDGTEYRYTIVFTNEDGGTPADRLVATWGRTTDIEFVYGVRVNAEGRVTSAEIQGPDHELLPFDGRHEDAHPLLWVTTDNNMVEARGTTDVRIAPAFEHLDLRGGPREAIMDRHPWSYRVMAAELAREGKVSAEALPGSGRVPPVRRFVFLDACASVVNAALALSVGIDDGAGGTRWFDVDRGNPEFRLARGGCNRVAVPVSGERGQITAVRARAVERSRPDEQPSSASVQQLGVMTLDDRGEPKRMGEWRGDEPLAVGGAWHVVALGR
jgi:hypothetical protein